MIRLGFKRIPYIHETNDTNVTRGASMAFSFMVTQAIASLGFQSFYPTIGTVAMWSAFGFFFTGVALKDADKPDIIEGTATPTKRVRYY